MQWYGMGRNVKTPNFLRWLQLSKKAITYVFAGSLIRNAEAVGSSPICSTNTPNIAYLARWSYCSISHMANLWTIFLRWIEAFRTAS